jgi:Nif-specific regulatory protein
MSGALGLVSVPVPLRGNQSGALSVYFEEDDPLPDDRLNVLRIFAAHIAQALRAGEGGVEPSSPAPPTEPEPFEYANMIGASPVMRQVYEQIGQVASTTATALIRGESGTGKELIAEAIHSNSARSARPFVRVNCGALPETLFESELFGHERGAFTGAHARKIGRFELASGGTLFLDEVGELPLSTQVKLLRILQAREFERVGGVETLRADVRLVAATNRDLEAAVRDGTFREDLYYRLNVFSISVPPLRHRQGDIQLLAEFFMQKHAARHARRIRRISAAAMGILRRHEWPGNVRELENAIERAVVVCASSTLDAPHLPDSVRELGATRPSGAETLADAVAQLERWMIEHALSDAGGNLARAARALGATERVLRYKATKYGIEASRFRT